MTPAGAFTPPSFERQSGSPAMPPIAAGLRWLARLPALALIALIKVYQHILSPVLPVITLGRCGCRFFPTCSHYAVEAIRGHGLAVGIGLAVVRLLKCTPLHPGGFDPLPARPVPRCARVTTPSL